MTWRRRAGRRASGRSSAPPADAKSTSANGDRWTSSAFRMTGRAVISSYETTTAGPRWPSSWLSMGSALRFGTISRRCFSARLTSWSDERPSSDGSRLTKRRRSRVFAQWPTPCAERTPGRRAVAELSEASAARHRSAGAPAEIEGVPGAVRGTSLLPARAARSARVVRGGLSVYCLDARRHHPRVELAAQPYLHQ